MDATLESIEDALNRQVQGWSGLYNLDAVNYVGKTAPGKSDKGGELDTEVVARWVLNRFEMFTNGITTIKRRWRSGCVPGCPYAQTSHADLRKKGIVTANKEKRIEEYIGQQLLIAGSSANWEIGAIVDYQVPLKDIGTDAAGKIDVLSKDKESLRILELKREDSKETMLRCVLESFTYFKTIKDIESFKGSFDAAGLEMEICPLFFTGSQPDQDRLRAHKNLSALVEEIRKEVRVGFAKIDKNGSEDVKCWRIEKVDL